MQLIGNGPDQIIPTSQLGRLAFQGPDSLVLELQSIMVPLRLGNMVFQLTSDTSLTIKVLGNDGVLRSVSLTLA